MAQDKLEEERRSSELGDQKTSQEEVLELLGSNPLLEQLPRSSLMLIAKKVKQIVFGPGDYIAREGEQGEGLYIIVSGEAEVSFSTNAALGQALPILKKGDFFGYASAGPSKELLEADVIAVNKVTCLVLMHKHSSLISADSIRAKAFKQDDFAFVERILQLETLDVDLFRGISNNFESRTANMYGGQLIGQALAAASKSVDPKLLVHSLHSYFLQVGDPKLPVYYQIERVRDGYTFAARHVIARQKGQQIFILNASFQKPNEDGPEHQLPMPLAPNPDEVLSFEADFDKSVVDPRIHPNHRRALAIRLVQQLPLDVRLCNPRNRVHPKRMEPREKVWVRARGKLSDDQGLHRCVAAYASDFYFLLVGLRPHALLLGVHAIPLSLDHSLWFHKSFRADEWLLFTIESPRLSNARGLVFGHFYTQSGELVISAAQEGLFWNPNAQKKSAKL